MSSPIRLDFRFAILSNVLPPAPSGQAIMLYRLLDKIDPDNYILLHRKDVIAKADCDNVTPTLEGRYVELDDYEPCVARLPLLESRYFETVRNIQALSRSIATRMRAERCELLVTCTDDLINIPAGQFSARRNGHAVIPYLFDDYLNQFYGSRLRLSRVLEPYSMYGCDGLIVTNELIRDEYRQRYLVDAVVVRNPCDMVNLEALDLLPEILPRGQINIVYAGAIYEFHYEGIRNLVKAIGTLTNEQIVFNIFSSNPWNEKYLGSKPKYVKEWGHIRQDMAILALRNANILFLPVAFNSPYPELTRTASPGKIGDYLSVGRPILVNGPANTFTLQYFINHDAGRVVTNNDPHELAAALAELIENEGMCSRLERNALTCAKEDYAIEKVAPVFTNYLQDILLRKRDAS